MKNNSNKKIVDPRSPIHSKSSVIAQRLKELRQRAGLSHDKLSVAIEEKYNVKISRDSLINYEAEDVNRTKAWANAGMRIEYLLCLSDFYGVSADYILGVSNVLTPNMEQKGVMEYTGLSEDSVKTLHDMKIDMDRDQGGCADIGSNKPYMDWLNDLLDSFYLDERLIATYYIALRRSAANGGVWYKNNQDGKTNDCDSIPAEYACMKIGREVELLLRRKYRVEKAGAGGGYRRDFDSDVNTED